MKKKYIIAIITIIIAHYVMVSIIYYNYPGNRLFIECMTILIVECVEIHEKLGHILISN